MPAAKKVPQTSPSEDGIVPAAPVEPVAAQVEPVVDIPVPPAPPVPPPAPYATGKPGLVQAIAIMTLVNGILNVLWGGSATVAMIPGVVTLCLVPFTILPLILGIFEIIYAAKLLSNPPQPVQPSQAIAIMEICCILVGNVVSLVVGILALVFYNDASVRAYFARLNGQG